MIISGASNRLLNGDNNWYAAEPFVMVQEPKPMTFDMLLSGFDDDVDHVELLGFPLVNFGTLAKKLDPMIGGLFKGFTPRWTLPAKVRNPTNTSLVTSCLLNIIDSQREVDLGMQPHFSQNILGHDEIMASKNSLEYLGVSAHHKEQLELYFDLSGAVRLVESFTQQTKDAAGVDDEDDSDDDKPDLSLVEKLLRNFLGYEITDDDEVVVDLTFLAARQLDLYNLNFTLPSLGIADALRRTGLNLTDLESLNIEIDNLGPLGNVTVKQLLEEDIILNAGKLYDSLGPKKVIKIPIKPIIGLAAISAPDLSTIETAIAHNFTVIEDFEKPAGKFPAMVGDVVLIDCRAAKSLVTGTYDKIYRDAITKSPPFHVFASNLDQKIRGLLDKIDFCRFAMTVNGQIDD